MGAYLYGFARENNRQLVSGAWGETLHAVKLRRLVALCGGLDASPALTASALRVHDRFVKKAFASLDPFLPARFGSFFGSLAELRVAVEKRRGGLDRALADVEGAAQMNVRVFGEPAARPKTPPIQGGPGAQYLERLRARRARETQLPELDPLRQELGAVLRSERCHRQERPPLVGSAYHLIDRDAVKAYRAAIRRAKPRLKVDVDVSGPFAPFAFAPEEPS